MTTEQIIRLAKIVKALVAVTDELESVWKNIGQTSPNRHAEDARKLLQEQCV
jgi:hypothetical protein